MTGTTFTSSTRSCPGSRSWNSSSKGKLRPRDTQAGCRETKRDREGPAGGTDSSANVTHKCLFPAPRISWRDAPVGGDGGDVQEHGLWGRCEAVGEQEGLDGHHRCGRRLAVQCQPRVRRLVRAVAKHLRSSSYDIYIYISLSFFI